MTGCLPAFVVPSESLAVVIPVEAGIHRADAETARSLATLMDGAIDSGFRGAAELRFCREEEDVLWPEIEVFRRM